ncbi:MAG: arsenate reductase ArsC [Dissulfurimicrobium sp.]|uniref:arsenate reductase ArsC n=1 Tax=Dissulfurimicrobium TaxID=1769732 RepID=UPI001EDA27EB|nr:arsenate reductase ArsC [Dissulfurimicrobium hydrothermale]UKL13866.1 arsenate reductase ArsC [Dissulfurimicrobium hydrothermale]
MKHILFLCTQNSCRSQMAEGIINQALKGLVKAFSAGTSPAGVHPLAVSVMGEIGIDISRNRSKYIDEFSGQRFDLVVTLCGGAAETCPFIPDQGPRVHFGFDDPTEAQGSEKERLVAFRRLRDEMFEKLVPFVRERLGLKEASC